MSSAGRTSVEDGLLGRLLLAFDGLDLPEPMRERLSTRPAAGVTLFRARNVASVEQVRSLVDAIQGCAPDGLPFLVAIDQEGGQLRGLGPASTPFGSAMALGAIDDADLTRRVARATGRELRAVGVNVNYAPVADLATTPANPSLGIRAFGDDPDRVARHVAATVAGLADAGVAATLKHFPGAGDLRDDPHHALPTLDRSSDALVARELVPFRAGIEARAEMVMAGHLRIPSLTGTDPATLSSAALDGLLRRRLGWRGVTVSDAWDMDALPGGGRGDEAVRAFDAGIDLVLLGGRSHRSIVEHRLVAASRVGEIDVDRHRASVARITALRHRLSTAASDAPVDRDAHAALAREVAERSVTLVRDRDAVLPLRPRAGERLLVVTTEPVDVTPADTSSFETGALGAAVRRRHPDTEALVVAHEPTDAEIEAAVAAASRAALVLVGTASTTLAPRQSVLARALLGTGRPVVTAALRTPWDLATYPAAGTHLCTYGLAEPSLEALAAVCFGEIAARGRIPVAV